MSFKSKIAGRLFEQSNEHEEQAAVYIGQAEVMRKFGAERCADLCERLYATHRARADLFADLGFTFL